MNAFREAQKFIEANTFTWLVTGVAGFIGSNILERLLKLNQTVIGLDNFSTGNKLNLSEVQSSVSVLQWSRFKFIDGDVSDFSICKDVCRSIDYVIHQAALGSVPRSINDPISSNKSNINGFLNMLVAAKEDNVKNFVYAASSSTYGDHPDLPKVEKNIGNPLSPYAVTKYVNELYANVFSRCYGFHSIGLRYFNVFGKRQDPEGPYAAVIPKWIESMILNQDIYINGDGKTSRDFCYIENVIQANILAAITEDLNALNQVYNVACGDRNTLEDLFFIIKECLATNQRQYALDPNYRDFRSGDVRHSQADISKISKMLGYDPEFNLYQGIEKVIPWYIENLSKKDLLN